MIREKLRVIIMNLKPYRRIGSLFPKPWILSLEKKLKFAGIIEDGVDWVGRRTLLGLLFAFACTLFYIQYFGMMGDQIWALVFVSGTILVSFVFYLELFFLKHERTKSVEKMLPDYLLLIVSNLRAGVPPFSAFTRSARPEFGALYDGIRIATARLGGKASIASALEEVSTYFDSPAFQRTTTFFGKGMKAGGHIAKLLERSAEEIRRIQDLRNELISGTRTYAIFLIFIVVLIMPFLLSVSTHFLTTFIAIQKQSAILGTGESGSLSVFTGNVKTTPQEMMMISILTLVITSFLVSALLGVVLTGMAPYGIKYFPIIAIASVGFFMLMREMIKNLIGSVVGA